MHRPSGPDDPRAVGGADALVAEADAQDRRRRPEPPHDVGRDPRFAGRTRPGGDDDMRRPERLNLLARRGVMASYNGLLAPLAHVAVQAVGERDVVVDEQDPSGRATTWP